MFRSDFPIFDTYPDLVYLDSASSTQKPRFVIEAMKNFLEKHYANIHRGAYDLSAEASMIYEQSKQKLASYLGAASSHEIVYTYNSTYAINLIARGLVKSSWLKPGDRILLSEADHHGNIVPWQILAEEYGIVIDWISVHDDGTIDYESLKKHIIGCKLLAITGASNVTGEVLDLKKIHEIFVTLSEKPLFLVDGSQRIPHMKTSMHEDGIDIFVGTGHKLFADTGIGFFAMKKALLRTMNPAFCGGGAINRVSRDGYIPAGLPFRHEPGTPHILGAASILAALEYIDSIGGYEALEKHEKDLTEYVLEKCRTLPSGVKLLGGWDPQNRVSVFSFAFDTRHPHDIAEMLADKGFCVRSGHHCAEPLHDAIGVGASLRISCSLYNTREDIDRFFETFLSFIR